MSNKKRQKYVSKADRAVNKQKMQNENSVEVIKETEDVKEPQIVEDPIEVIKEPLEVTKVHEQEAPAKTTKELKAEKKKDKKKKDKRNKDKKKVSVKDWIIVLLSAVSLVLLIFIIYTTKVYDQQISDQLIADSKKENNTIVSTVAAIEYIKISEVNAEGWVELYNTGTDSADISGLQIYVSGNKDFTVPDGTTLQASECLAFEIGINPGANENNVINVIAEDEKLIDSLIVPKLTGAQSYGLTFNDDNNAGFIDPSKGKQNSPVITKVAYTYVNGIGFSTPGGFYDSTFSLSLSSKKGEKIYYTTDGSEPTTESNEYTGQITISSKSGRNYVYSKLGFGYLEKENYYPTSVDAGMVVRAITVNSTGAVTGSASQEYYIGLANDSAYKNIPVLSLTVNPDDMFSYYSGIYVPGRTKEDAIIKGVKDVGLYANYLNDWSRDGQVSFFETTKDKTLEKDATVKMQFDVEINSRQKSMKLNLGDVSEFAGSSLLKYVDSDGSIVLQTYIDDTIYRCKDLIVNRLMEGSSVGTIDMTPCIVFIDGEFWGVYLLKSPINEDYFLRNYDVKTKVIVRENKAYQSDFMNLYNFVIGNDMSNSSNYTTVKKKMDVDSYIEYVCSRAYLGYIGARTTSGTQWRTESSGGTGYSDGRWRWIIDYPIGNSLGNSSNRTCSVDTFLHSSFTMDKFFQSLLMNKEFCQKLEDTMATMTAERFSEEKTEVVIDEVAELMKKTSIDTYARFYGSLKDTAYNTGISVIKNYFANRPQYITFYTKELAEKGGDLEYIKEMEALGLVDEAEENLEQTTDENGELISTEELQNVENQGITAE